MKALLLAFVLLTSISAFAEDSKHQIMFGNKSFGWNAVGASAETDKDKGIKNFTTGHGELNLNYAYRVATQFQLGLILNTGSDVSETKLTAGGKIKDETMEGAFYIFGTWNFSENLSEAWYLTLALGQEKYKSELKDAAGTKTERDYDLTGYSITVGKRISLSGLGIQNLTYSPSLTLASGKAGGDFEDSGVESISTANFNILKFDLLF